MIQNQNRPLSLVEMLSGGAVSRPVQQPVIQTPIAASPVMQIAGNDPNYQTQSPSLLMRTAGAEQNYQALSPTTLRRAKRKLIPYGSMTGNERTSMGY